MSIKGSTILVTGGAGFIGSHIVDDLVARGAKVRVLDNFSFGRKENLPPGGGVQIIEADILNQDALMDAALGVDYISHQAAQLEIFRSTDDPVADLNINTIGTLNVLKAARDRNVRKVINASSACIYGQVNALTTEEHLPVPNWAYGVSKLAAERYAQIYNDYHHLPVVNLRYGIVYGEREWFRRVLTIFVKRVIQDQSPVVFGIGDQIRDFIHVSDVVALNRLCLESDAANGKSYNVGSGRATTIKELAQQVVRASGKNLNVLFEDVAEGSFSELVREKKRNTAELKVMLLDCAKARRDLDWTPAVTLLDGLGREMRWAAANLHRWDHIHYTQTSG